jgi:anti-sigma factor RsiW
MKSDFPPRSPEQPHSCPEQVSESAQSLPTLPRDRFELLSAYMDGEVSAAERQQVEDWLAHDPTVQKLHLRLLALRDGFQALPTPASDQSTQQTIDRVLARIDRRPKLRLLWGGAALAAAAVGAVTMLLTGEGAFQTATTPTPLGKSMEAETPSAKPEAILIALDKPVVMIPKAPISVQPSTGQTFGDASK